MNYIKKSETEASNDRVQRLIVFVIGKIFLLALLDHNRFVNKYLKKGEVKVQRIDKLEAILEKWKRN